MENAAKFKDKLQRGIICIGAAITFSDPTVGEALANSLDFIWIDAEHGPHTIESIQGHIMATKGTDCAPIVRVPWNDPVLIKPVLDAGAAGIIAPMVCTADETRRLVAACRYPPEGIRGYGPRRPGRYGTVPSQEVCKTANENILCIPQIEHIEAVKNIESILDVPGVAAILIGPNDLAASMGLPGQPNHADVQEAIETVYAAARKRKIYIGNGVTDDPKNVEALLKKGVSWVCIPPDYMLLLNTVNRFVKVIREFAGAAQ